MQHLSSNRLRDRNSGAVLHIFAVAIVALLAFVALALDLGNTMRLHSKLQIALDAAALRAAQARFEGKSEAEAVQIAEEMTRSNLQAGGISNEKIDQVVQGLDVSFPLDTNRAELVADIRHGHWFAGILPGVGNFLDVSADSNAEFQRRSESPVGACFVFVFDRSGSMGTNAADGVPKIEGLKQVAADLVTALNEVHEIGIVYYNHEFGPLFQPALLTPDNRQAAITQINTLTANGTTSISGAMWEAHKMLQLCQNDFRAVVLMTDGMPNQFGAGEELLVGGPQDADCDIAVGNPIAWSDSIKQSGTPVFSIGFGAAGDFWQDFLERIAGEGSLQDHLSNCDGIDIDSGPTTDPPGAYYAATTGAALAAVFDEIVGIIEEGIDLVRLVG